MAQAQRQSVTLTAYYGRNKYHVMVDTASFKNGIFHAYKAQMVSSEMDPRPNPKYSPPILPSQTYLILNHLKRSIYARGQWIEFMRPNEYVLKVNKRDCALFQKDEYILVMIDHNRKIQQIMHENKKLKQENKTLKQEITKFCSNEGQ
eukprot:99317_1